MTNGLTHTGARSLLTSVDLQYDMCWSQSAMLVLCIQFLNRHPQLADAFHQHLLEAAKRSRLDADGPGTFDVDVCRTGFGCRTLRIVAASETEARRKADDEAGGHDYSEHASAYSIEDVRRVAS